MNWYIKSYWSFTNQARGNIVNFETEILFKYCKVIQLWNPSPNKMKKWTIWIQCHYTGCMFKDKPNNPYQCWFHLYLLELYFILLFLANKWVEKSMRPKSSNHISRNFLINSRTSSSPFVFIALALQKLFWVWVMLLPSRHCLNDFEMVKLPLCSWHGLLQL